MQSGNPDYDERDTERERSPRVRGVRYGLTDWSPHERADGFRAGAPGGMEWGRRNPGVVGEGVGYRGDDVGRAALGRDRYGHDEYGSYGTAAMRGDGGHAGKGPKGWQRSDARILEDVSEALARHPSLDPSDIEVEVDGGEVRLTGTIADRRAKRMAEDVAETVFAVRDVHNHLRIRRDEELDAPQREDQPKGTATSGTIDARKRSGRSAAGLSSPNNPK